MGRRGEPTPSSLKRGFLTTPGVSRERAPQAMVPQPFPLGRVSPLSPRMLLLGGLGWRPDCWAAGKISCYCRRRGRSPRKRCGGVVPRPGGPSIGGGGPLRAGFPPGVLPPVAYARLCMRIGRIGGWCRSSTPRTGWRAAGRMLPPGPGGPPSTSSTFTGGPLGPATWRRGGRPCGWSCSPRLPRLGRPPWVIGGDWNSPPGDVWAHALSPRVGGLLPGPAAREPTCFPPLGVPSEIDFFLVSRSLRESIQGYEVLPVGRLPTHRPVRLTLWLSELVEPVPVLRRPRAVPDRPRPAGQGGSEASAQGEPWGPPSRLGSSAQASWDQWTRRAEQWLLRVAGVHGAPT